MSNKFNPTRRALFRLLEALAAGAVALAPHAQELEIFDPPTPSAYARRPPPGVDQPCRC